MDNIFFNQECEDFKKRLSKKELGKIKKLIRDTSNFKKYSFFPKEVRDFLIKGVKNESNSVL